MIYRISVDMRWDGALINAGDVLGVVIADVPQEVRVQFTAHLTAQYTTPPNPPAFTDGLWEYDVVELFFARPDGSYVEIEVGPAGHWLVYEFTSYRQASDKTLRPLEYTAQVNNGLWQGSFVIPQAWLKCPLQECRVNVYQIRSTEAGREYLAWRSLPAIAPDFHRVECFESLGIS